MLSDESDEHQLPIVLRIVGVGLDELRDRTTHKVGLVDLIGVTDGRHPMWILREFEKSMGMFIIGG